MTGTRLLAPSFVGFQRAWIRPDVIAGLTVWAVLVPESLAYATIAGVPPVVGLYAAMPALVLYALVGSSRHLVVVADVGDRRAVLWAWSRRSRTTRGSSWSSPPALALATGLAALLAGVLRLGFLAAFISEPVLKGFIIGLALTIMIGQVPALIGVDKGSGNFFEKLWDLLLQLGDAQALATVVGLGSLAVLLGLRRWAPRVPASLVVAAAGHRRGRGVRAGRPRPGHRREHRLRPPVRRAAGRQPAPTTSSCSVPRSA